jgi:hypothetical protein
MAVRLSVLRTGRALLPINIVFLFMVLISVRCCVNPGPKELGELRKFVDLARYTLSVVKIVANLQC